MTSPHWYRRALFVPFALLFLGTVIGGQLNRVDAHGVVIDDTSNLPITGVAVSYGQRSQVTGDDGRFAMDNLPRGAMLSAQQRYYGRKSFTAETTEVRIEPLTVTFHVKEAGTDKGVKLPEARQPADTQIGKGTDSGEMVVGPYPSRLTPVLICAQDYQSKEITPKGYEMNVELTAGAGSSCPPLKSPSPAPVPSPSASPSGSASPAPSPSPSPSASR